MTRCDRLGAVACLLALASPPPCMWADPALGEAAASAQETVTPAEGKPADSAAADATSDGPTGESGQGGRPELTDPGEAELDALAAEVAGELRCPVCRNQSVLESNAGLSREMQDVVRERLAAGESPEEVKAYFVSRYGEWILLKPTPRGINLAVYVLPLVALVGGAILLRERLRKWAAAGDARAADARSHDDSLSADNEAWLREAIRDG